LFIFVAEMQNTPMKFIDKNKRSVTTASTQYIHDDLIDYKRCQACILKLRQSMRPIAWRTEI